MLTSWAKIILGSLAYFPLFVVLLIKNLPLKWGLFAGTILFAFILLLSWSVLCSIRKFSGKPIKVKIDRDLNDQYVGFIVTYIVPFIGAVKTVNDIISMAILLLVIFSLYLSTSLFAVNPLLKLIFGYNLYLCTINNKDGILLSKENLKRNEELFLTAYCIDENSNIFIQHKNEGETT
ncbi:hypothetical protein [Pyrococcus yayanosii]|uniref:Uncharacterized protein n=1 Tax=Pyrococcus yayanosii (strain CH1 / JCM 16557) TaxID=529709 RepID=F8AIZ3_PYRYC|nr:hypothetical protein [Pyrococcus yayanosii]AEH24469.1 hypothetical protein PYCH_07840 [Pyrococcus yayanosii CH1]